MLCIVIVITTTGVNGRDASKKDVRGMGPLTFKASQGFPRGGQDSTQPGTQPDVMLLTATTAGTGCCCLCCNCCCCSP